MCVTFPGKIISKKGMTAVVESNGRKVEIKIDAVPDVKKEDWILVYGDLALKRMSKKEAEETIKILSND
ncbi:HypC/HybG/HupF family hydrogenase formation chaperone [Patescibacteria group bacterium]|nr:HypC/HybG/HupF family hydrogenase formation chaperone [Patescibacteria group bacterium]MBU1074914.1 HypC/HybG/HupF family hydrogenase formation chaperone [Patescibacteria group bacterium]MBU1952474.1 HypC/HybG/HupF family hydrogenase formation chaperone [Patescibacteria group bacterium]MBU2235797.1 HypC/HybG/HupF family hydrogenase formation chaperone [Patescibacteria group bacterium]